MLKLYKNLEDLISVINNYEELKKQEKNRKEEETFMESLIRIDRLRK